MNFHPAKFNPKLVPVIDIYLGGGRKKVLDPFAGTGWIFDALLGYDWVGIEIEPDVAAQHHLIQCGSALDLPFRDGTIDAVATSPTYANRLADHFVAKDGSKRYSYRHAFGHELHPENSGRMQWGEKYRAFHVKAWQEVYRVLIPKGIFILNLKNHIRKGQVIDVIGWHKKTVLALGFRLVAEQEIELSGNNHGQNGKLRVPTEWVGKFVKD